MPLVSAMRHFFACAPAPSHDPPAAATSQEGGPNAASSASPGAASAPGSAAVGLLPVMEPSQDLDVATTIDRRGGGNLGGGGVKVMKQQNVVSPDRVFTVLLAEGDSEDFHWVSAESQGRRSNMEDAHVVNLDIDGRGTALFGIMDGHAGKEVASFAAQHMVEAVLRSSAFRAGNLQGALHEAILDVDAQLLTEAARPELYAYRKDKSVEQVAAAAVVAAGSGDGGSASSPRRSSSGGGGGAIPAEPSPDHVAHRISQYGLVDGDGRYTGPKAGSTACVVLIRDSTLAVASAGDSRAVLSDGGKAVALTIDHKPTDPVERRRIEDAGLFVLHRPGGIPRVGGSLAMSRALGDAKFKSTALPPEAQAVTAVPDTVQLPLDTGGPHARHDLLVIACDGLYESMNRQHVISFLSAELYERGSSLRHATSALVHEALRTDRGGPASADNITAIVVQLK